MSALVAEVRARNLTVTEDNLVVDLSDGRSITVPLAWYPRLQLGTREERNNWRWIGHREGIHWPDLDEDISVENLPNIRLMFAKQPTGVDIGDILFVHRIKAAKLACVTEAMTSARKLTADELLREPILKRWPWRIDGKNLSPKLGWWWRECSLKTFTLAIEYSELNSNDRVNLGSLNRGNDKLKISEEFAKFLIETIIAID